MSSDKIPVVAVSYLNTKPFLYGLESPVDTPDWGIRLDLDTPRNCAEKLRTGKARIGLVPAAVVPELPNAQIISSFCIGCLGAVKTVCLYAHAPLDKIRTVYLDYQSRTSVRLVQILAQHLWKIQPVFLPAYEGFERQPLEQPETAAVVIGDRTIGLENHYQYVYDLGEHWYEFTRMPFVFAVWVLMQDADNQMLVNEQWLQNFDQKLALGIANRDLVAQQYQHLTPDFDLHQYYHQYIQYGFGEPQKQALQNFWSYL